MAKGSDGLRERTRRAVRAEILGAAERVFLARGYEATTVEEIATAAEMSPRSVYRYFPTKDDLLAGRFLGSADRVLATLRSRPDDEPIWDSLRCALQALVDHADGAGTEEASRRLHRAIFATPTLLGRYLQHLHATQSSARDVLIDRTGGLEASDQDAVAVLATVHAAFGSFIAAQQEWCDAGEGTRLTSIFDIAIRSARPAHAAPDQVPLDRG